MKNIKLIGTSHIAQQSVSEVKKIISEWNPDIVAVELDPARLHSLFQKRTKLKFSDARQLGLFGYVFAVLGSYLQNKLGNEIGISPGADMKNAILAAKNAKAKIALIDQPINITLQRLSKNVSFWEKAHLFFYIIYLYLRF